MSSFWYALTEETICADRFIRSPKLYAVFTFINSLYFVSLMNPVYAMATSLGMDGYAELEVSTMDPTDKKPAFRGLKLYVKELDSKTLPPFLARLCAPDKPSYLQVFDLLQ